MKIFAQRSVIELAMPHYQQQILREQRITITGEEHTYLGPDLLLESCQIFLRANSRNLTISGVRLDNCQVEAKKKLTGFSWCAATIIGTSFRGTFISNDFGRWPEVSSFGKIDGCDFGGAILDGCRFMGCKTDSIIFPPWPCFAVLRPNELKGLETTTWPGELQYWFHSLLNSPPDTEAVIGYVPTLTKKFGGSDAALKDCLIRFGNAIAIRERS